MSKILLAVLMLFGVMANVQAGNLAGSGVDVRNLHHKNFAGQRPYVNPVVFAKADAEQPWVGASLVVGQDQALKQQQIMKMHMIGKRAF